MLMCVIFKHGLSLAALRPSDPASIMMFTTVADCQCTGADSSDSAGRCAGWLGSARPVHFAAWHCFGCQVYLHTVSCSYQTLQNLLFGAYVQCLLQLPATMPHVRKVPAHIASAPLCCPSQAPLMPPCAAPVQSPLLPPVRPQSSPPCCPPVLPQLSLPCFPLCCPSQAPPVAQLCCPKYLVALHPYTSGLAMLAEGILSAMESTLLTLALLQSAGVSVSTPAPVFAAGIVLAEVCAPRGHDHCWVHGGMHTWRCWAGLRQQQGETQPLKFRHPF